MSKGENEPSAVLTDFGYIPKVAGETAEETFERSVALFLKREVLPWREAHKRWGGRMSREAREHFAFLETMRDEIRPDFARTIREAFYDRRLA